MLDPLRIEPDAIYDDGMLCLSVGLTHAALATARRTGRLRYTRAGNRTLYLGRWVLAWLESTGEGPRLASQASPAEEATP
jgi:hypothetical protein